jgi:hypothetical protein
MDVLFSKINCTASTIGVPKLDLHVDVGLGEYKKWLARVSTSQEE